MASGQQQQQRPHLAFSCALVTGGAGGIGKAMASYFISRGKKVLIADHRTESELQATADEIGAAGYYVLDTAGEDMTHVSSFVDTITADYPELDCLVNITNDDNKGAGAHRPLDVSKISATEFLHKADEEINVHIRGPMHLTLRLLDHFRNSPSGAVIVNVSSVLGYVPFSVINPVYSGTKAWMHFWSMNLRTQLERAAAEKGQKNKIKVVEIAPPSVETDSRRGRDETDDNKKKERDPNALSAAEFMDEVTRKLEEGDETIGAGMSAGVVQQWYDQFGGMYDKAAAKK